MNWTENWPTGLMWVSVLLFVGALFGVVRFLRNASERRDGLDWSADEDADEIHPERRPSTKGFIAVGILVFVVGMALSYVALAHRPDRDRVLPPDGVLWTPEALLRDFFRSSEEVTYQEISLTPEERAQLAALTRTDRENPTHLLYVARTGKDVDGYAFLSEIRSSGDPAAFGVQLGADGRVKRVDVMRLLDADQQEVLDPRFLHQYEGRTLSDAPRLHRGLERPVECTSA
ncbi:MAG: hypothetical protein HKN10_03005, partial [Myxococcales bacterium]|nr:hypothetical protein [Myxococcales bacterium]